MKHNLIFKHVAMSALLLSAIGAPVVANAETGQKSREIISSQVTKLDTVATTKMMSLNLNDPLELAKNTPQKQLAIGSQPWINIRSLLHKVNSSLLI